MIVDQEQGKMSVKAARVSLPPESLPGHPIINAGEDFLAPVPALLALPCLPCPACPCSGIRRVSSRLLSLRSPAVGSLSRFDIPTGCAF